MEATYFDHNATTPVDPRVRASMASWLGENFGNPSSIHAFGQRAREAVEASRQQVARLLGVAAPEIVFTASGTEANNTVLQTCCQGLESPGHLVVSAVEHPSVRQPVETLAAAGWKVTWIEPDSQGRIDAASMTAAVRSETRLVSLVLANNVVGTVQPVAEVATFCREADVPLLCDAVQAVGKIAVHPEKLGVDYLTLGAHKFYGPLGAAALWVRQGAALTPLLQGGAQERRRRAGTQNVAAIVGLGRAAELAQAELEARSQHVLGLRRRFEGGLQGIPRTVIHGERVERLPNTTHVALLGVDNQALLIRLDLAGFAVSAGSACSAGTVEPSQTLVSMGVCRDEAMSAIRVSFGEGNTREEVDRFLAELAGQVAELRRLAVTA
jgi:cysteine desulfurase